MKNLDNSKLENFNIPILPTGDKPPGLNRQKTVPKGGFSKVVAGGRVIRLQADKPFMERMITGHSIPGSPPTNELNSLAVLESIQSNLEAGINIVDCQETGLAKIGGRLSEIALSLNQVQSPRSTPDDRIASQHRFEQCQAKIRQLALLTYDGTALFSKGPSKPITITIPTKGRWEGLSIDRGDLGQPGLVTIDKGKVYGDSPGYLLDSGSIKRAYGEWRTLCITNRMQWGLLRDRLRGIVKCLLEFDRHRPWKIPELQTGALTGPLRRPNQNN
jgi:hypothetical protein